MHIHDYPLTGKIIALDDGLVVEVIVEAVNTYLLY